MSQHEQTEVRLRSLLGQFTVNFEGENERYMIFYVYNDYFKSRCHIPPGGDENNIRHAAEDLKERYNQYMETLD
jgi:hypothetical protein